MDKLKTEVFIDHYRNSGSNNFYDSYVHNNIKVEKYDETYYNELIINNMLLYYLTQGKEKLIELGGINIDIPSSVRTLKDFRENIEKYKNYQSMDPHVKNLYEEILDKYAKKILNKQNYSWLKMYSEQTTGEKTKKTGKIYLSVNNKDLHKYATLLLHKCMKFGIQDYQFKIADDDDVTRKDNVVIYFTNENFSTYIEAIEEIKNENSFIKFDESNFLAYQYDEHITVAKDFEEATTSYTNLLSLLIDDAIEKNLSTQEIVERLERFTNKHLQDVINLCEETKQKQSNKKR